ncbi:MAG: InlB B-repeat-containing protein [Candidatus Methanoplasma sp.]|nr:InlB B-repeat-containing protein [Candidatus Methanoplasma sp.]
MFASRNKAVIFAICLVMIASLSFILIDNNDSSATTVEVNDYVSLMAAVNDPSVTECVVTATIYLPHTTGPTGIITIDGNNGTRVGLSITADYNYGSFSSSSTVFIVPGSSSGKYNFKNLSMNATDLFMVDIGACSSTVTFDNIKFTGSFYEAVHSDPSNNANVTVNDCYFRNNADSLGIGISMEGGTLTLSNSFFSMAGDNCVNVYTPDPVSITNCYMEVYPDTTYGYSGSAVVNNVDLGGRVQLSIDGCTFVGTDGTDRPLVMSSIFGSTSQSSVKVVNSIFKAPPSAVSSASGIDIWGETPGNILIDKCLFSGLRPSGSVVQLSSDTSKNVTFIISNTTFESNSTVSPYLYMETPVLSVVGMDGVIVNSSFLYNTVTFSGQATGCVFLDGVNVDLFNNTFRNNVTHDGTSADIPASLQIASLGESTVSLESSVNMINNLFALILPAGNEPSSYLNPTISIPGVEMNYNGSILSGSVGIKDSGKNNIDKFYVGTTDPMKTSGPFVNNIIGGGYEAGCDLGAVWAIWGMSYTGPSTSGTIPTEMIAPFGDADGKGAMYAGSPAYDQRGQGRTGLQDIGAVSTPSAGFDANGGYWNPTYSGYSSQYPYQFYDAVTGGFSFMGAAANSSGEFLLPDFAELKNTNSAVNLLGWSTVAGATVADLIPSLTYTNGTLQGSFAQDKTYYAVWSTVQVVVFSPGNGYSDVVVTVGSSGMVASSEVPSGYATANGMKWVGWSYIKILDNSTAPWYPSIPIGETTGVISGNWEVISSQPKAYKVTFSNGGQSNSVTVNSGDTVSRPADPIQDGYEFKGWFTSATGGSQWDFGTPIYSNIILYAQWEETPPVTFNVTFDPMNGNGPTVTEAMPGGAASIPGTPVRDGFTFDGWYTSPSGGTKWDAGTPITGNVTLYAHWVAGGIDENNKGSDAGNIVDDTWFWVAAVVASTIATLGLVPVVIMGFSSLSAISGDFFQNYGQGEDEEKNRRTVVFDPRNGGTMWSTTVISGRKVSKPSSTWVHPRGMKFSHWSEIEGGPPFDFNKPITKTTNIHAEYVKKNK